MMSVKSLGTDGVTTSAVVLLCWPLAHMGSIEGSATINNTVPTSRVTLNPVLYLVSQILYSYPDHEPDCLKQLSG